MTQIHRPTARACWKAFEDQLWAYWGRLQNCGRNKLRAPWPVLDRDEGQLTLGGQHAREHVAMATSGEVSKLVQHAQHEGVLIGRPPFALLLGHQRLSVKKFEAGYTLHTTDYKYTLAVSFVDQFAEPNRSWFALRLESTSAPDEQSWFLNHPIHHHQLGSCGDLRLPATHGRALISFIDAGLRAFASDVWQEMYPALFAELREGAFRRLAAGWTRIDQAAVQRVEELLRQGRAHKLDWYHELEQWRMDIGNRSATTPELFDLFLQPEAR